MKKEMPGGALIERLKIAAKCGNYRELVKYLEVDRACPIHSRKTGKLHDQIREKLVLLGINPWWVELEMGKLVLSDEVGTIQ